MNYRQRAKQDSYKVLCKEAAVYASSVSTIPKFEKGITHLKEVVEAIDKLAMMQRRDLKGITADKGKTIDDLIEKLIIIAGALYSYALEKENLILRDKVKYSASSWEAMNHTELLNTASVINDELKNIPAEALAEEGISAEDVQQFEELFNYYNDVKTAPREAIIDRSGYTAKMSELFKEGFDIVKGTLDKLVYQFKEKDPDFYHAYKAARNIINYGSSQNNSEEEEVA